MSAWGTYSPYAAVGIYIGGTNRGCAQKNLTAAWVSAESAAGWHMIPIYVGLQAPGACSCQAITPSLAASQGTAAAQDAVVQAQALGIGTGNPIYLDMEGYKRSTATTSGGVGVHRGVDRAIARQRLPVGRVQQRRVRHHRPREPVRDGLRRAGRVVDRGLGFIATRDAARPALRTPTCRAAIGRTTSNCCSTAAATTRSTAASRFPSTTTTSMRPPQPSGLGHRWSRRSPPHPRSRFARSQTAQST